MEFIYNDIFLGHDTGAHPENRTRLESMGALQQSNVPDGLEWLPLVHSQEHIEFVKSACASVMQIDADTLTSEGSFAAATHAAGAAVLAAQTNCFALVRPPGHHAYASRASGFCLFNNIAVAAQKLVNEDRRVAILDFDGHYGDGTADIFYETDQVLYCSMHQYPAFPGKGGVNETGSGKGKGYTVNVPLPAGAGDDLFMRALEEIFLPIIIAFKPDALGVSAGFDASLHDPLLQLRVSNGCFYEIGKQLTANFKNIFAVLEGGYNTTVLPHCVFNFVDGINCRDIRFKDDPTSSSSTCVHAFESNLDQLKGALGSRW